MVIDATTIFLSWREPPEENRNGIIRQYVVTLETANFENITIISTETNITATNLHPYTAYQCSVAAETVSVGVFTTVRLETTHEAGMLCN